MAAKKKPKSESVGPKKLSPFDFINNINEGSKGNNLLCECYAEPYEGSGPDSPDKAYVPFMVNRGLSYFNDSVLFANEMNRYAGLPSKMQYDFLRNGIRPRKRFSKWFKRADDDADIKLIMQHYNYNRERACEARMLLSDHDLTLLRKKYDRGGKS